MLFSLRAMLCVALLFLLYRYFPAEGFQKELFRLRLAPLLLAALGYLAIQLAASLRFSLALGAMGFRVPLARVIHLHFVSLFFNMLLPGGIGGDAAKGYYLRASSDHWGKGILAALLDRYLGLVSLTALALASGIMLHTPGLRGAAPLPWILGFLVLTSSAPYALRAGWLRGILRRGLGRFAWASGATGAADEGIRAARRPRLLALGAILTLSYYMGSSVVHLLLGKAFGAELEYWPTFHLLIVVALVSSLPLLPGAHGQREAAYVVMFTAYGLSRSQSFLLAALALGMLLLGAVVGGFLYLTLRASREDGLTIQRPTLVS